MGGLGAREAAMNAQPVEDPKVWRRCAEEAPLGRIEFGWGVVIELGHAVLLAVRIEDGRSAPHSRPSAGSRVAF